MVNNAADSAAEGAAKLDMAATKLQAVHRGTSTRKLCAAAAAGKAASQGDVTLRFTITVPAKKKAGDTIKMELGGNIISVTCPETLPPDRILIVDGTGKVVEGESLVKSARANAREKIRSLSLQLDSIVELEKRQLDAMRLSATGKKKKKSVGDVDDSSMARQLSAEEPEIHNEAELDKWRVWAKTEAKLQATLLHPTREQYKDPKMRKKQNDREKNKKLKKGPAFVSIEKIEEGAAEAEEPPPIAELETKPLPLNCSHDELMNELGIGIRLYFDFLLFMTCVAFCGILVSLPSLIASLNYLNAGAGGREYDQDETRFDVSAMNFPQVLSIFSLGARVSFINPTTNVMIVGCNDDFCKTLNWIQALLDSIFCIFFFYATNKFIAYARAMADHDDAMNLRVNDYSIWLHGLYGVHKYRPLETYTPAMLGDYIEGALAEYAKKLSQSSNERLANKWKEFVRRESWRVWDVTLIAHDRGLLRDLVRNVPIEQKVFALEAQAHRRQVLGKKPGCFEKSSIDQAIKQRDMMRDRVDKKSTKPLDPVGAFVTFEDERAVHAALELWGTNPYSEGCCRGPPEFARVPVLDATGAVVAHKRLRARKAPMPGDVLYEDMATHYDYSTKARRCIAWCVLVCVIIVSLAISITAFTLSSVGSSLSVIVEQELQRGTAQFANATAQTIKLTCTADKKALIGNVTDYLAFFTTVYEEVGAAFSSNNTDSTLAALARSDTIDVALAVMDCYITTALSVFTSFITIILNLVITSVVSSLADFSNFSTYTEVNMFVVLAVALAQFLNTAVVIFIINWSTGIQYPYPRGESLFVPQENHGCWGFDPIADYDARYALNPNVSAVSPLPRFTCAFGPHGIFLRGSFFTFDPKWYVQVGSSICFTMFLMPFTAQIGAIVAALTSKITRCLYFKSVVSLEDMTALFVGPECALTKSLGKLYAFTGVVLVFSSLMPILFLFLLVFCFLAYFVDKWAFLRIYRTPPPFTHTYISDTLFWVQFALTLKLLLGWYAFWQMPGYTLAETTAALLRVAFAAADGLGQGAQANTAFAGVNATDAIIGDFDSTSILAAGWFDTSPKALFAAGFLLMGALIVLQFLLDNLPSHWLKCKADPHEWHPALPLFSGVLKGSVTYSEVRTKGEGVHEKLFLRGDVYESTENYCFKLLESDSFCYVFMTPARFARLAARSPIALLLYAFGIKTWRPRLTPQEFEALRPKEVTITGKLNMSYAPIFNPRYERAFKYAELAAKLEKKAEDKHASELTQRAGAIMSNIMVGAAAVMAVSSTAE